MKTRVANFSLLLILVFTIYSWSQQNFDFQSYQQYLTNHDNISSQSLMNEFSLQNTYYQQLDNYQPVSTASFMDSVILKYELTADEQQMLSDNHFVVTERLAFDGIGWALHHVYNYDLPVFISSDAVLHAMHTSYDRVLMDLEVSLLGPTLVSMLEGLYNNIPDLAANHNSPELQDALADVDLYVTMALSLLKEQQYTTQTGLVDNFATVWNAIEQEQASSLPLFSERSRNIDFSQFTVRGHYNKTYWDNGDSKTLGGYFQAMMWLGRIEVWITPPPENPWEEPWTWQEIQRMARVSLLLNELMDMSNAWPLMQDIEKLLTFFVGENDNLTPAQLAQITNGNNITLASIADSTGLAQFQNLLLGSDEYSQKILSAMIMMDPYSDGPDVLPVAYKLMGQRFVIDSYVLGNVVYDRIVHNGSKVWRPLPDPMDAMFVLGNDNTLPLLQEELDTYHYSQNLAGLRYLVDSYDQDFWDMSLYNSWLTAVRALNTNHNISEYPLFMQSAAWQHKSLNTQLASWAQLRHDNLLYAKQSYTGMTGCSFPHSFIEPCPELYRAIKNFANNANGFFAAYPQDNYLVQSIKAYFQRLGTTVSKLETLAAKELAHETFSENDIEFLQGMLFLDGGSGMPPFSGWFADLFYEGEDASLTDYVIADVHTQPTDNVGNMVGHVLHVGDGKFNLGFFVAPSPSSSYNPMVFVGPVMSYYEKTTRDFKRLTDKEWQEDIRNERTPERPDWTNIYLADKNGNKKPAGRELAGVIMTNVGPGNTSSPRDFYLSDNYPNPFNPVTIIDYSLPTSGQVSLVVYDIVGRKVAVLVNEVKSVGLHQVKWNADNAPSGIYFYRLQAGPNQVIKKMTLVK